MPKAKMPNAKMPKTSKVLFSKDIPFHTVLQFFIQNSSNKDVKHYQGFVSRFGSIWIETATWLFLRYFNKNLIFGLISDKNTANKAPKTDPSR